MSCERGLRQASMAGLRCGLSAAQSQAAHALGRAVAGYTRLAAKPNSGTLRVIESFDGPPSLNSLLAAATGAEAAFWLKDQLGSRSQAREEKALLERLYRATPAEKLPPGAAPKKKGNAASPAPKPAGAPPPWLKRGAPPVESGEEIPAWLGSGAIERRRDRAALAGKRFSASVGGYPDRTAATARQAVLLAVGVLKLGNTAGNFAGTGLARLSRQGSIELRVFFPHSRRLSVGVWRSKLTPLLNRQDRGPGRIKQSDGLMFEVAGKSWHRGAIVIDTAQGERTLTHLQSMTAPGTHYYFNRRLNDTEAVGIVSGQRGFEPKYMDEYVGQISEVESLSPRWAMFKKNLIRTRLRWGGSPAAAGTSSSQVETGQTAGDNRPGKRPEPANVPLEKVGDRVRLAGGREHPVIIRRVREGQAEAAWYDEDNRVWKEVAESGARRWLAKQVETGNMEIWDKEGGN